MSAPSAHEAAELLEALVRHAMAEHATIADRGFDSAAHRAKIRDQIDAMLDEHLILTEVVALEAAS